MLTDRIKGAFTFRKGVYAEVEGDTTFTRTAWIIVVVVAFLNQLGSNASADILSWLGGTVLGTIIAVIGFAVAALVINWVGRTVFKAEVSFDELVRTLGLAYVWQVVAVIGVLSAFSGALKCILGPIIAIAAILLIIAWFVAAKEALDLEWLQTIITIFLGWIALIVILAIGGAILGMLGLGEAALGGALGF